MQQNRPHQGASSLWVEYVRQVDAVASGDAGGRHNLSEEKRK
jgi:hypothetical protein